jgi:F-box and leucine-rich repeat protein 10/11
MVTYKTPARKSTRKRNPQDYASVDSGAAPDSRRWLWNVADKMSFTDPFKRMDGVNVNLTWLEEDETAMLEPIVIESPEGLGLKMPANDFAVDDVADLLGEQTPVDVIGTSSGHDTDAALHTFPDVASQSASPGWTLGKWADYVESEPSKRDKIYNVISLEVSGTKVAEQVLPPKIVRDLDWVENFWPSTRRGKGNVYPKVQLYCLMGVQGAWTVCEPRLRTTST